MRALIADDHWVFRLGLSEVLSDVDPDLEIVEAGDFNEAIAVVEADKNFDFILLDLLMPGLAPFEGLEAIMSKIDNDVPVIVMSMVEDRGDVLEAIKLGASGYIPKTSPKDEFVMAVRRVLSGEVWVPKMSHRNSESLPERLGPRASTGRDMSALMAPLTARQREILLLVARGKSNIAIAKDLGLSPNTVKLHVSGLLKTLNVSNRTEAATLVTAGDWLRSE
ncbi:MAG: response regulator transcription factor [Alphaproteobacteria bacterium]|nr:response regulator transcription factor [Alphaproteobacteria bacterium]